MTWWYRNLEIGRVDHDKNFEVHGQGPLSLLEVAPLSGKYFGDYSCRAENIHGSANHSLELVMAREPTIIQQAVLDRVGSGPGPAHCALSVICTPPRSPPPRSTSASCRPPTSAGCRWTPTRWSTRRRGTSGTSPGAACGR